MPKQPDFCISHFVSHVEYFDYGWQLDSCSPFNVEEAVGSVDYENGVIGIAKTIMMFTESFNSSIPNGYETCDTSSVIFLHGNVKMSKTLVNFP